MELVQDCIHWSALVQAMLNLWVLLHVIITKPWKWKDCGEKWWWCAMHHFDGDVCVISLVVKCKEAVFQFCSKKHVHEVCNCHICICWWKYKLSLRQWKLQTWWWYFVWDRIFWQRSQHGEFGTVMVLCSGRNQNCPFCLCHYLSVEGKHRYYENQKQYWQQTRTQSLTLRNNIGGSTSRASISATCLMPLIPLPFLQITNDHTVSSLPLSDGLDVVHVG